MKLCGSVHWCRIGWLIVVLNLLFIPNFTYSQNLPPVLDIGVANQHAVVGSIFAYTIPSNAFKDENNDPIAYNVSGLPAGLTYNTSSRLISGTPTNPGISSISLSANDGTTSSSTSFNINVRNTGTFAAFTMNTQTGCNYRLVNFSNRSSGAVSYYWVLGNGNTSTLPNPSAVYDKPGLYTVTLTINGGGLPALTHTEIIRIFPNPSPKIANVTANGCEPMDLSLSSTGAPVFISGKTINGQVVGGISGGVDAYHYWYFFEQHNAIYNQALPNVNVNNVQGGKYNVMLEVTDQNGCQGIKTAFNLFEVYNKPEPEFTFEKSDVCLPSLTTFYDKSQLEGSKLSNSNWTINGAPLANHNDTVSFDFTSLGTGNYPVSLSSVSEHGCVSTLFTDTVKFNSNNTANFSLPTYYCKNDTLQLTAATSVGSTSVAWDIGNNGSIESNLVNYRTVFNNPGQHSVKLTAYFNDGCQREIIKTVQIDEANANFNFTSQYNCATNNYQVTFTNTSSTFLARNIASTRWYLISGSTATLISSAATFNRTFINSGDYTIRFDVRSIDGCNSSITKTISLQQPSLSINVSGTTLGCLPAGASNFQATFNSAFETPTSYSWNFGNGNTGTGASTSHTYLATGSYNVSVTVNTSTGCTYSATSFNAVKVSSKPSISSVNLIQAPNECFGQGVQLNVNYSANVEQLSFITPTGLNQISTPGASPYNYNYAFPDTGKFSIEVYVTRYGCISDTFDVLNINSNEPKASFNPAQKTFCELPPYHANFINTSSYTDPLTQFFWDFGDGTTSNSVSPSHEYLATGNYTVRLTATNPTTACSNFYEEIISIYSFDNSPGIITADLTSGCSPLTVNFSQNITSRLSANYLATGYEWDFNNDGITDSITNLPSIQHTYTSPGLFSVRLKVKSATGCDYEFTETDFIRSSGPIVNFSHLPAMVCLNTMVNFTNTSTKPAFDTALPANDTYLWDFGDGITSTVQHPNHQYTSEAIHSVSLTVNDQNGCSSTLEKTDLITIIAFEPLFSLSDSIICNNTSVVFNNTSTGLATQYNWDFDGNGTTDLTSNNLLPVNYTYNIPGIYNAVLEAVASDGCRKTYVKKVRVVNSSPDFTATATNIGCAPAFAYFTPVANAADVISYSWNFGDGNVSNERAPKNFYVTPGTYTVSLQIQFKGACSKTEIKTDFITVEGAFGEFNYDKTLGCAPNPILFSVSNMSNVDIITWDFGTGSIATDTLPSGSTTYFERSYTYDTLGYVTPKIILTDAVCGEYAYDNPTRGSIYSSSPPVVNFGVDNDSICKGVKIQFSDSSISNDPLYPLSSWKWNFGTPENDSTKVKNPQFAYKDQGVYSPQLIVSNTLGCSDTLRKNNSIFIYGNSQLSADFVVDDYLACPLQNLTFTSTANAGTNAIVNYEWNFGEGAFLGNTVENYAFADSLKGKTINIIHRVTDDKFCIDSTVRTVEINNLQAAFGYDPQPVFRGSLVDFVDQSTSDFGTTITNWNWSFENGSPLASSLKNPQDIDYSVIGTNFNARLIVTNNNNCVDTSAVSFDVLNNLPTVDTLTITLIENTRYLFKHFEFANRFNPQDPGQTFDSLKVTSSPANGSFLFNGNPYSIGTGIPASQISKLQFVPTPDWNGNTQFLWSGHDGYDWAALEEWVYVVVLEEPDPPTLTNIVFNLPEDSVIRVVKQDFINHVISVLGSSFEFDSLQILNNLSPAVGTFTFNGNPVVAPMLLLETQINDTDTVFQFTPPPGFNGTLSLSWNAHDGYNFSDNAAQLIFNYYNTAPIVTNIIRTNLKEDALQLISKTELNSHFSDIDRFDSSQVFYLSIPPATEGAFWVNGIKITANNYSISYNQLNDLRFYPAFGYEGTTQATWGLSDGTVAAYALIQFTFVNTPPIVHNFTVTGFEDETKGFLLTDFTKTPKYPFEDVDNWDQLKMISIKTLPANGVLRYNGSLVSPGLTIDRINIGGLTYLPNPDWNGTDFFKYNAFDGTDWAVNDSTVFINVQPVNDAPRPQPDYYSIDEDEILTGRTVGENDKDIDDNYSTLRFSVAPTDYGTAGENGTVVLNPLGYLTFTPNPNFYGSVYFVYTVCDDDNACAKDSVFINVTPVNDAPVAVLDSFFIYEDEVAKTYNCLSNDSDIDGDFLSLESVNSSYTTTITTAYGLLTWDISGKIIFTLNSGLDTLKAGQSISLNFDYTNNDIFNLKSHSKFIITILGRNNAPVAVTDEYTIYEGDLVYGSGGNIPTLLFNDTDPEKDILSVRTVNNSTVRNVITNYGTFNWQPNGSWTFTQIHDATDSLYQDEYVQLSFPYTNFDGVTESNSANININLIGVNDAPVALDNYLYIFEDVVSIEIIPNMTQALLSNDSDIDGDNLSVITVEGNTSKSIKSAVGTLNWNTDGSYTYIPDADSVNQLAGGQTITDIFNYTISDPFDSNASAQLIITITGLNDAPFAMDDYIDVYEDTRTTQVSAENGLLANDGDIDHDPIVVAVNGQGTRTLNGNYGTLTWDSSGAYTYITQANLVDTLYFGERVLDVFTYLVNDPSGETDMANLYITIIGENDAPVAKNHYEKIKEDDISITVTERSKGILAEDSDIDDGLNFGIIEVEKQASAPTKGIYGELNWNADGTFTYTLNALCDTLFENEVVIDSFLYTIEDAFDSTAMAWLFIEITGENDIPEAKNDTLRVTEDFIVFNPPFTLLQNDGDKDGDKIELYQFHTDTLSPTKTKFASFNWESTGKFIYNRYVFAQPYNNLDTLAFDDFIVDSVQYIIKDQHGVDSEATLFIQIQGVNDAPITKRDFNFLNEITPSVSSNSTNYLLKNDYDVDRRDSIALIWVNFETDLETEGQFGTLSWNIDGSYTYTNRFESTDSLYLFESVRDYFPYAVIDKQGAISIDTLEITITGTNDKPVAVNDTLTIQEDERILHIHPTQNGVLWNDYDVDGDFFGVLISGPDSVKTIQGNYGVLTIYENGQANYQLNSETDTLYFGEQLTEYFNYIILDIHNATATASIIINIVGDNDIPVSKDDFVQINEDIDSISSSLSNTGLLQNDFDIDGDVLQVIMVNDSELKTTPGNYGELQWDSTGAYLYLTDKIRADRLAQGDTAVEVFTYIASDPYSAKDTAQLKIEILGVNDSPVARINAYQTLDIAPVIITTDSLNDILDNDYDVDGEIRIITLVNNQPINTLVGEWGTLTWNADGSFIYVPDSALAVALRPNEMNIDEFEYTIADEFGATDTSLINFSILGINNAPIAFNDSLILFEDDVTAVHINGLLFNDKDPDRDTLLVTRIENDTLGVVTGLYGELFWNSKGEVVFTPNRELIDQLGPKQIETEVYTYTIIDEGGLKTTADLIVKIIGENDPIVAVNDTTSVFEDEYVLVDVLANDVDPDNAYLGNLAKSPVNIIRNPENGKAFVNTKTGVISYFPNKNYFGKDSIRYRVCDDEGSCSSAWVIIDVIPVNDPPKATHLILKTEINTPIDFNAFIQVVDIDDGIDPASFQFPQTGLLTYDGDSTLTYTPVTEFVGRDEFIYSLADYSGARAYVIVNILIPDEGEGAQDDYATTSENTLIEIDVLKNDTLNGFKPNPLSVDILIYAENGIASYDPIKHLIQYQPSKNYNGLDSLIYLVESTSGIWDFATVHISVEPINSPIIANDDATTTYINQVKAIPILLNDTDIDNGIDFGSVVILQYTSNGSIKYDSLTGRITYTPSTDYKGPDYFTYRVCDLDETNTSCDSAQVFILVKSKFDGVVALNDTVSTDENTMLLIDNPHPTENDENISRSSFTVLTNPQHGTYTVDASQVITYIPTPNYFGPDWITYKVCDANSNCDFADINIWVNEINTPPIANDDNFVVTENMVKRLSILSNDYDLDGELDWNSLDSIPGMGPRKGTIVFDHETGTILYTPSINADVDKFTYKICDNDGLCSQATVTITVDLGSTILYHQLTYEDTPDTFDIAPLLATYNFYFNVTNVDEMVDPLIGNWDLINNNTQIVYTPKPDSNGNDYYNLILYGINGDSADLRVTVTILPVNDAPVAVKDTLVWKTGSTKMTITFDEILWNDYDVDGDSIFLTRTVVDLGDSLHVTFNTDSTITVKADTIFWCDAWFTYEIKDPSGESGIGYVFIMPELEGILAINDTVSVDENSSYSVFDVMKNDWFKDNQECTIDTIHISVEPSNGLAYSTENNKVAYRPIDHYYGPDSLQYTLIDIWGQTSYAWVIITVIQRNQPPVAVPDVVRNNFGETIIIHALANDYDPDPDGYIDTLLTYITIGKEPLSGTVTFNSDSGYFVYTPIEFSCSGDEFGYTIFDNEGDSASTTVTIQIPKEAPLFAVTDTVKTWPGIPVEFNVLSNDQGYFLPFVDSYTLPAGGIVEQSGDSTFLFYPNSDFAGKDSMTYQLVSPCNNQATGWVIFMIEELRVPEIITPNNDSKNDVLIIDGIEHFPDALLQVFNRYGHIVFQSKGYDNTWGGYSNQGNLGGNKPLPSGSYYYTLTYNKGINRQAGLIYIFR